MIERADAHAHLFEHGFSGVLGMSPVGGDELAVYEHLRSHHAIQRALIIGYEGEQRYLGNNDYVLTLAGTRKWIIPIVYLSAESTPTAYQLVTWHERGAAGYALYLPDAAHGRALCSWSAAAFDELRLQQPILSVNATPPALAVLVTAMESLAGCQILVSHLGLPGRFAQPPPPSTARERLAALLSLARWPDVSVKLSGLYAISDPPHSFPHAAAQPFVDVILDTFGPSRVLWGSDFSPALDHVSFAQLADIHVLASCSPSEVTDVMGGNLVRLLDDR